MFPIPDQVQVLCTQVPVHPILLINDVVDNEDANANEDEDDADVNGE